MPEAPAAPPPRARVRETWLAFVRLGCTSFGGPYAHLGYLRRECVERRRWLSEAQFTEWLALCQSLPGPKSSQLGMLIGWQHAGGLGALAAVVGFALPSLLLMGALAQSDGQVLTTASPGLGHGLKLVALVVVVDAVRLMLTGLAKEREALVIAALATVLLLSAQHPLAPVAVLGGGLVLGAAIGRTHESATAAPPAPTVPRRGAVAAVVLFGVALTLALAGTATGHTLMGVATACARAGALVFGGAHVVLPMLEPSFVGPQGMARDVFFAGYGAAQAMPGPLFSIAAFLGAVAPTGAPPVIGSLVAVVAIYAPGLLLVMAVLPVWTSFSRRPRARAAIAGVRGAAVGVLASALYDPLWVTTVQQGTDLCIAAIGLAVLQLPRHGALLTVAWCVGASLWVFA